MAGTLNFIKDMKEIKIGVSALFIILLSWILATAIRDICFTNNNTSSPVEEMYHRQLVVTLDSILDARFGDSCCKEDIDTDSANTFRNRFGGNLVPME